MKFDYKVLFESMFEGVVVQDFEGKILQFNQAALDILALSEDQLFGRKSTDPSWKAVREDGRTPFPGSEHPAMVTLKTGTAQRNVVMGLNLPKNEFRWILINSAPITNEITNTKGVICTFTNITTQLNLQKELELSKFRLDVATKAGHFGIFDWNLLSGEVIWDENMFEVFGVSKEAFTSGYDTFRNCLIPEDINKVEEELQKAYEQKIDFNCDFRINKNGEIRTIRGMSKNFYDQNGQISRLVGMNWDVTDVYEREAQLAQNSKLSALGELAANIVHEINNPLAIILGKTKMVSSMLEKDGTDKEVIQKHVQNIQQTAEVLGKIVNGLRSFSRDSSRDDFETSNFSKIVEDAVSLCQFRFSKSNVKLQISVIDPTIEIKCRSTQLMQVIMNLLNNAFDAVQTLDEKWVSLDCQTIAGKVYIKIIDSGKGIPTKIHSKIMQPFFTTKQQGKGTGLGLSISRDIVKMHGGSLEYDSSAKNTTFIISLPLA